MINENEHQFDLGSMTLMLIMCDPNQCETCFQTKYIMFILDVSMIFLTCAGVSLALISSLWCFLALRRYSMWGRRRRTQINNPVRKDKSKLTHLQCISMTLLNQYELPVCGQMRVISWSWIRHGPSTPDNTFALPA